MTVRWCYTTTSPDGLGEVVAEVRVRLQHSARGIDFVPVVDDEAMAPVVVAMTLVQPMALSLFTATASPIIAMSLRSG